MTAKAYKGHEEYYNHITTSRGRIRESVYIPPNEIEMEGGQGQHEQPDTYLGAETKATAITSGKASLLPAVIAEALRSRVSINPLSVLHEKNTDTCTQPTKVRLPQPASSASSFQSISGKTALLIVGSKHLAMLWATR